MTALPSRDHTLTIRTGPRWRHPEALVPYMAAAAAADASDPAVVAFAESIGRHGRPSDLADRILRAVSARVQYVRDEHPDDAEPTERLQTPHVVLRTGRGDCDCMATLIGSVARILGLEHRFCVVASRHPDRPHHVWTEILTETGWTAVDPVLRPPSLGRRLDGLIRSWDSHGQEERTMPSENAFDINWHRGVGSTVPLLPPAGLGQGWEGLVVDQLAPYIDKAIQAVSDFFFGTHYDPYKNFTDAVALRDAFVEPAATPQETIARILAAGIVPIYCSDSEGARNRIEEAFRQRGWIGIEKWGQSYARGGGSKAWYYGLICPLNKAPQSVLAAARARAGSDVQGAWNRTIQLCTNAKSFFRTYNPAAPEPPDWDAMMVDAIPVIPQQQPDAAPPGAVQVQEPTAPPTTPPARLSFSMPSGRPPAPTAPTAPPPGAVQVQPPAGAPPAAAPPGAVQVRPPTGAASMSPDERALIAALQTQTGIDQARRAAEAARRYLGLGQFELPSWPMQTMAPTPDASADLEALARRMVYSVTPERNRPMSEQATRTAAFQRAAGLPQTNSFDAATRQRAADLVGAWVLEIPIRRFDTTAPGPGPSSVPPGAPPVPPGQYEPTDTGLPAAALPGIVQVRPVPGGDAGPVMVSPPTARAETGGFDWTAALVGAAAAKVLQL